jgi:PD-(D/E)XK nuclease superfamily protein
MALNGATEVAENTEDWVSDESPDPLTERIIGAAIEVHRQLGPGLFENIYLSALCVELNLRGLRFQRQVPVPILYKDQPVGDYRLDLLVEDQVVVEVKAALCDLCALCGSVKGRNHA